MRTLLTCTLLLVACSAGPSFNAAGDREYGHEMDPCADGQGGFVPSWHHCHNPSARGFCCPDGMSCSQDDFVTQPKGAPPFCRFF